MRILSSPVPRTASGAITGAKAPCEARLRRPARGRACVLFDLPSVSLDGRRRARHALRSPDEESGHQLPDPAPARARGGPARVRHAFLSGISRVASRVVRRERRHRGGGRTRGRTGPATCASFATCSRAGRDPESRLSGGLLLVVCMRSRSVLCAQVQAFAITGRGERDTRARNPRQAPDFHACRSQHGFMAHPVLQGRRQVANEIRRPELGALIVPRCWCGPSLDGPDRNPRRHDYGMDMYERG